MKIVCTIHDTGKFERIGHLNCLCIKLFCDDIIAISDGVKQEVVEYGIDTHKVTRIYNAVNLDSFIVKNKSLNKGKHIVIGNVARIMPQKKGQDILINAISILKNDGFDVECRFAGATAKGKEYELVKLQDLAVELGVQDDIKFYGNVNDVPRFLSALDLFVLPSRYEGFGISLIEAMAMGIPCVSSDVPGVNEIISSEIFGEKFMSGDCIDLANKIACVIKNIDKYDSEQIRKYVEQNFSIESMCNSLMEVYMR